MTDTLQLERHATCTVAEDGKAERFTDRNRTSTGEPRPGLEEHERMYRKFVGFAKMGIFGAPVLLAFVLYWYM
jgi:hypothetical protein